MPKRKLHARAPLRTSKAVKVNMDGDEDRPTGTADPMPNHYQAAVQSLLKKHGDWTVCFHSGSNHERFLKVKDAIDEEAQALVEKYAWAVPDERSLRILAHFSPLVEIGSGKGYWARLLRDRGVDVVAYDKHLAPRGKMWTEVRRGGPEVLKKTSDRALFLCYPDEQQSIAAACLDCFMGDVVVHVGEMAGTGTVFGPPVGPFGRTSSAEFQVQLSEAFHCVLVAELSVRLPLSRDCISVWKRTTFVQGGDVGAEVGAEERGAVAQKGKDKSKVKRKGEKGGKQWAVVEESAASSAVEFVSSEDLARLREAALDVQYNEEGGNLWNVVPAEEVLPIDRAAPILAHLLE